MNIIQNTIVALSTALLATPAFAQDADSLQCDGNRVSGSTEIVVDIQSGDLVVPGSSQRVTDYVATLGPGDSQNQVCFDGDSTLVFTLSDSRRYALRDIGFEYPFGFEPAGSPSKLWAVHPQSLVVHVVDTQESEGATFKYTIKVEDLKTGAVISIDPMIINR